MNVSLPSLISLETCPSIRCVTPPDWRWVIPGSLVAVVLWVVVSLGFKLYIENVGNYNVAYGSLGGAIVLILWFYLSRIVLLIGGELNAEIGKAAGRGRP